MSATLPFLADPVTQRVAPQAARPTRFLEDPFEADVPVGNEEDIRLAANSPSNAVKRLKGSVTSDPSLTPVS